MSSESKPLVEADSYAQAKAWWETATVRQREAMLSFANAGMATLSNLDYLPLSIRQLVKIEVKKQNENLSNRQA